MSTISPYRQAHGRRAYQAFIADFGDRTEPNNWPAWTDLEHEERSAWVAAADAVVDAFVTQVDGADD